MNKHEVKPNESANETRAALLRNIFLSDGKAEKVLKFISRNRSSEENFISAMRLEPLKTLATVKSSACGALVMRTGSAHVHEMDTFY